VIEPEYVPAASVATEALAVTVAGPEPPAGSTESHETFAVAVQPSEPPPPLAIPNVWGAGSDPPTEAAKERFGGLTTSTGDASGTPLATGRYKVRFENLKSMWMTVTAS